MKVFLTLFLTCFHLCSLSQSYIPTLNSSKEWKITRPIGMGNFSTYSYKIQCDTTISNYTYKKVENVFNNGLRAFVREDTMAKKLFILKVGASQEVLLIDFDLNLGDTTIYQGRYPLYVDSITTDYIYQQNRRVIHFTNLMKYIEGIGNSFYGIDSVGVNYSFIDLVKPNPPCTGYPTAVSEIQRNVQIVPNPATDILRIELSGIEQPELVYIYSIDGKLMLKKRYSKTIDVSHFSNGLYFLKVDDLIISKFIKK